MVVRSESMKPSLHVGDILVTYAIYLDGYCSKRREVDEIDELLKKGDVIVMEVNTGRLNTAFVSVYSFTQSIINISLRNLMHI